MKANMIDVQVGSRVMQFTIEQADKIRRSQEARQRRLSQFLSNDRSIERLGNPGNQLAGWIPGERKHGQLSASVRTRHNVTPAHEHQHTPTVRLFGRTLAIAAV
jgi:hypothetical protein